MLDKVYKLLLKLSRKAIKHNEVPVAAVLVADGKIVSYAYNKRHKSNCVFDHAEIIAISKYSKKINEWRLNNCSLYVTIEPCEMCKLFIRESRISNVYYLFEKSLNKKMFSKTDFFKIDNDSFRNEYKKISDLFWKNKR